jgi:hypothetical protein
MIIKQRVKTYLSGLFPNKLMRYPSAWLQLRREKQELEATRSSYVDEWLANAKNIHDGKRAFIIATGPSLNDLDLSKLKGEIAFGVNGTYMLANVDLTYFAYVSNWWHKDHLEGIRKVRCQRRFLPVEYQEELESSTPTSWYRKIMPAYHSHYGIRLPIPRGLSYQPENYIHAGGTVIFVCLQLALHMGFKEVIIIGLDHSYKKSDGSKIQKSPTQLDVEGDDHSHFSKDYFKKGTSAHIDLAAMERGYALADKAFRKEGKLILNASSRSDLKIFPRIRFDDLV